MNAVPSAQSLRVAADRMVSALAAHADPEYRLTVLKRLVRRLGEDRYPVFLRLLGVVAESDDTRAQRLLADTIGTALRRMDLPGGALSSWGATRLPDSAAPVSASDFSGQFFGGTPRRMLGPVEYLTVWHLQRTQRTTLSAETFHTSLSRMIALLNQSEDARTLYPQKLAVDAQNELEGAYTRATRERLAAIATAWKAGRSPDEIAQAALDARATDTPHGWVLRDL
ncbi:hypothetical protein LU699_09985 [Luteimonas fraxinea]|uniref:Uncharacterized protein n=1 Tax=Luteimonas fraxinea TaxID=2901869 RepID=A0ABS8UJQ9_9GAMM|nr:hypothetical protein [Luteimonas fraxinea]MCD9098974.1 hypothetical protein [Luteimonas fraxinea]MCD9127524.1 hypothetical protein [Luteimonas fraxinea]UHH08657.1 hypothetical protein LU699_09985 [Luteimonas fraxinea]